MTLKRSAAFAAAVLLPLSGAACTTAMTSDGGDVVIAANLELSGAYADVGTAYRRALELKVNQINARGGVHGRKLRLDVRDNRSDPTVSESNVSAFVNEPDLTAVVSGWCGECLVSAQNTLTEKTIPTVSLSPATAVASPVSKHQYTFKIGPNIDDDAVVLANQMRQDKIETAAIVATNDMAGSDAITDLKNELPKLGIEVTDTRKFQPTDTDLSQPISGLVGGGFDGTDQPDALVVSAFSARALSAAAAAKGAGFRGHIYFDQAAAGDLFMTGMGSMHTDGITMVATPSMVIDSIVATSPAKVARRQWFNDYTSSYGNFSEYSTYAADAVQLIVNAVSTAGDNTSHQALRDAMEASQFEGLSGQIRMSPETHSGLVPQALSLLVSQGDRWQPA